MEIEKMGSAAAAAFQIARQQGVAVGLTVVDEGGHVRYQARMEGANFMTNEASYLKAKTAFLFKCPSHFLQKITETVPILNHVIRQVPGDAVMIEGGLPLQRHRTFIGGVGVAGGNFTEDLAIATAFVENFNAQYDGN